jgi:hypothetical protein
VPGSEIPAEQNAQWNSLRESHMVDEFLDALADALVLILICRVTHVPVFVEALQTKFTRVEQYDVTKLAWFDQTLL